MPINALTRYVDNAWQHATGSKPSTEVAVIDLQSEKIRPYVHVPDEWAGGKKLLGRKKRRWFKKQLLADAEIMFGGVDVFV